MTTAAEGWAALDWLARTCTPAWLDAAGLERDAEILRALPPLTDMDAVWAALEPLRLVQASAYRRSGVLQWPEVDCHTRPFGAMFARNVAFDVVGRNHLHPDSSVVLAVADRAATAAAYAAHGVPDDECKRVAEMLAGTLPAGVEG